MNSNKQNQKITIPQKEYQKLKREYEELGRLLEKAEQQEKSERKAADRLRKKLKRGYDLGSLNYNSRSELHQR